MKHIVNQYPKIYVKLKNSRYEPSIVLERNIHLIDYFNCNIETLYEDHQPLDCRMQVESTHNTLELTGGESPMSFSESIAHIFSHNGETQLICELLAVEERTTAYLLRSGLQGLWYACSFEEYNQSFGPEFAVQPPVMGDFTYEY